jgi:polysaccharide biosynthesis/export protein
MERNSSERRRHSRAMTCWLFVTLAAIGGCAPSKTRVKSPPPPLPATRSAIETVEYRLVPRDVLEIKLFYQPELNESLAIRPDGKISLQLVGEINAAGLTPNALAELLTEKYAPLLRKPEVAVIVKDFAPRQIYIGGEVNTPGPMSFETNITVLQAIMQAGGYKRTGELGSVVVLRNQGTTTPLIHLLNLKGNLKPDESTPPQDMLVQAQDIIFVPQTTITKLNDIVEQYIEKMIPGQSSVGVFYDLGPAARP